MSVSDGVLPSDIYGTKAQGNYVPNVGVVAQQGGVVSNDLQNQPSAPSLIQLLSGVANQSAADSVAAANLLMIVQGMQTGTSLFSPRRIVTKFVQIKGVALNAGTPVSVYTPTSGKKFRILCWHLSASAAACVLFEDTTGTEVLRTGKLPVAIAQSSPDLGNGYLSTAANNQLFLDADTGTPTVNGFIGICEE